MKTKHTPGPWTIEGADVYTEGTGSRRWIASCGLRGGEQAAPYNTANARLIACAPDLLEMLNRIRADIADQMDDEDDEFLAELDALIARAEGTES